MTQKERRKLRKAVEKQLEQDTEAKLLRQFEARSKKESRAAQRVYVQRVSALTALTRNKGGRP